MNSEPCNNVDPEIDKTRLSRDILIVDDEIPNLRLLSEIIKRRGYKVRASERPQLAIDSALAHPPALILLDVRMPEMDGYEVCKRLKQNARTSDIPVIFISALQDVQDRVRGFEAGGVDFISKPFQDEEILARVRTHMDLRNMQLHLEEMVAKRTAELAKSEARYRGLVDNSIVGVFTTTIDGRFKFVNDAMVRMFNFDSPEQMIAWGSLERWKDLKDRERMLAELHKHGRVTNFEAETITHTDRKIHILFSARLIGNDIFGMVMDITERKRSEEKLLEYQDRLKALAAKSALSEEKARRVIATNLHDQVGQSLALARIELASAIQGADSPGLEGQLEALSDNLLKALEDTQLLMLELSSPVDHGTGLSTAVSDWLQGQIGNRHNLITEVFDNLPKSQREMLDPNVCAILFRNIRELIINVVKHARASKVSVRLEDRNPWIRIIVEDDGIGFDPLEANGFSNISGGFGLFSIKELMADLGGSLRIVSEPGRGCTAILSATYSVGDNQRRR